ncbi:MAG: sulfate permease [Thermoflexales bacterium]|nr:sulfate permease [Thermoflexales bacterium]
MASSSPSDRASFWGEVGGALGDLGTLVPLAVALITVNGLPATGVFFGFGVAYILAGLFYRLPIPVQPLKAVAAIAIARGLSGSTVTAAGWWMGLFLLLLALTDASRWLERLFTRPVVRGIQLGLGLMLVRSGVALASRPQVVPGGEERVVHLAAQAVPLGWLLAALTVGLLLWGLRGRRWPPSLPVLAFGGVVALTVGGAGRLLGTVRLGLALPVPALPRPNDLAAALVWLVLPQIPLTLGNAVFATVDTARAYFGPRAGRVTPRNLLATMGVSQLVAALFGGLPVCHGSGGLTAHYRLGARTGLAPILIGALCLALALFVDGNALPFLALVPYPVLGALLAFVGVQHAWLARDLRGWEEAAVALLTAGVGFATGNLALGFGGGILLEQAVRLARWARARRATSP